MTEIASSQYGFEQRQARVYTRTVSKVLINVSALSEARFQEELRTGTMVRRAFDKAVRRKPPVVAADAGPYGNSIEGRCGVEMHRGCAAEHDRRQRKMKR